MNTLPDLLHAYYAAFLNVVMVLVIAFVAFAWLEKMFTCSEREKSIRASLLDLQYVGLAILFPPTIYFVIAFLFNILAIKLKAAQIYPDITLGKWIVEFLLYLFVRDILIYVRHRIFHTRKVWAFHSIHHSSEEVNWISAFRFHPAEKIIEATGEIVLFTSCTIIGFDPAVLSAGSLVIGFYNLFIHSNLSWTFGPLRYVLVSPVFHRWHHSDATEATDKNFAAMFSCLDLALGTFYMPANSLPQTLGLSASEKTIHPRTLPGQLLYPFRKRQAP